MRLVMRMGFTRCTLVALFSLGLLGCASVEDHEQESLTADTFGSQPACNSAGFAGIASSSCADSALHRPGHLVVKTTVARARDECAELADFASLQGEYQPRWT